MTSTTTWQDLTDAWWAEWTKTRALASTGWLLATSIALGIGLSAAVCAIASHQPGSLQYPTKLALTGTQLAQAVLAIWAVRSICGEYRTGLIHITLTAIPQRGRLLAAKTSLIATLALAASTITVTASLLIARTLLAASRSPAHQAALNLTTATTLRAACGSTAYLALLAAGLAFATRDAAATTATMHALVAQSNISQPEGVPYWRGISRRAGRAFSAAAATWERGAARLCLPKGAALWLLHCELGHWLGDALDQVPLRRCNG